MFPIWGCYFRWYFNVQCLTVTDSTHKYNAFLRTDLPSEDLAKLSSLVTFL